MFQRSCGIVITIVASVKIISATLNTVIFFFIYITAKFTITGGKLIYVAITDTGTITGYAVRSRTTIIWRFCSVSAIFFDITINNMFLAFLVLFSIISYCIILSYVMIEINIFSNICSYWILYDGFSIKNKVCAQHSSWLSITSSNVHLAARSQFTK